MKKKNFIRNSKASSLKPRDKFNRRSKKFSTEEDYTATSKPNDVAWYSQNEQLLRDVASFSYNYPVGGQMPHDPEGTPFVNNTSVPGIMTIAVTPRYGVLKHANDPVNIAMRNVYTRVRGANSGKWNYEAPDLMLYLLAMDSCYSFIAALKRAYGTVLTYSYTNRYFPMAAVHAQGFNFLSLQKNIADFRAYINTLVVKVGSMCIPASLSYMARHQWMFDGMYYDTPNDLKAQVYMYVPEAFYRYTLDSDGAGALQLLDFDRTKYSSDFVYPDTDEENGWKFEDIVAFGNALIDPILSDQDMNVMSGDILKAFGPEGVYKLGSIPETYTVIPAYSQEVLNQIHNSSLCGRSIQPSYKWNTLPAATADNAIVQSPDKTYLLSTPHASQILVHSNAYPDFWDTNSINRSTIRQAILQTQANKKIVDFESGPVSPGDAMVATRLTATLSLADDQFIVGNEQIDDSQVAHKYHGVDTTTWIYWTHDTFESCGSETAGFAKIWYYANVGYNSENGWCLIHTEDIYSGTIVPTPAAQLNSSDWPDFLLDVTKYAMQRKSMVSVFNMHPAIQDIIMYCDVEYEIDSAEFMFTDAIWPQFDINYYTVLDSADITQMHEIALLSELSVTQFGRRAE